MAGGRKGGTRRLFSEAEDAVLRANYHAKGGAWVAEKLGRTHMSVRVRAQRIGIADHRLSRSAGQVRPTVQRPKIVELVEYTPQPVPDSWRRLAQFDPVVARAVRERDLGIPPKAPE